MPLIIVSNIKIHVRSILVIPFDSIIPISFRLDCIEYIMETVIAIPEHKSMINGIRYLPPASSNADLDSFSNISSMDVIPYKSSSCSFASANTSFLI